jgi:hypothetical protein
LTNPARSKSAINSRILGGKFDLRGADERHSGQKEWLAEGDRIQNFRVGGAALMVLI